MIKCFNRSILYHSQSCKFIINLETVINNFFNLFVYMFYCAICKFLFNVLIRFYCCNVSNCFAFNLFVLFYIILQQFTDY